MKTIGLLGGMSFESTAEYYKIINSEVRNRLGSNNSAKINMYSFNFQEIEELQFNNNWEKIADLMIEAALKLQDNGSDLLLLCTNSVHKIYDNLQKELSIPVIHIADAVSNEIKRQGYDIVGLLGTKFTMEEDFYRNRMKQNGVKVIIPNENDRTYVHKVIYEELCRGIFLQNSTREYENIMENLIKNGAQGVVLGCTEIPLLVKQSYIPLFNTTLIHAHSAVDAALLEE